MSFWPLQDHFLSEVPKGLHDLSWSVSSKDRETHTLPIYEETEALDIG